MAITPLPPAPEPTDSTQEFNQKAFAWVAALDGFTTEANALATAADADATTATTQAGIATTKAGEALTSANNASSSASAALTSANNAANSASAALTSANNAAASYDAFDDRYLGSKTSNPTVDNDGNTLLVGALYFNSVANEMRVWNGTTWESPVLVGGTVDTLNVNNTLTATTGNITTVNATTVDTTNIEITNLKAKDGTAAGSIANSTGVVTLNSSVLTTTDINGGTIDGVAIGSSSASTGAFTTLSASSTVSGNGFSNYLASPPAIGGTVPAAGTFTTATATTGNITTVNATTVNATTINATSLVVSGDITWTQSTDSYSRLSGVSAATPVITDVHRNMRRCVVRDDLTVNYYLDPTNSALKEDGTSSVLTGADGQVMVQIPAFYVKFTPGANRNYAISLLPAPGFVLHPAFMKDGEFVPYRYYGAYDACVFNGSVYESGLNYDNNWTSGQDWSADGAAAKLSSVSGVYPAVGATRANFRTMAANRGTGWRQVDFYLESAVQLLYLVEYGSFNSQAKLGDGNVSVTNAYNIASSGNQTDSPHSVAGKSNSLGNASTNTSSGAASGTRDNAFMSYRGIENWYGNCWNFVDGFNINNNQGYVTNVRSAFADDTATGYNILGAAMSASDGYVTNVQQIQFGFLPSAVGGSTTTYLADYYYQNTGWRVALFGGIANDGADAGAFCWLLSYGSGDLLRAFGGRLAA